MMLITLREHARGGKGDLQDHFKLILAFFTVQASYHEHRPMQDIMR